MTSARGHVGLPSSVPGEAPAAVTVDATVVVRTPGAAGYGRHAAPPSAYGPADVHRLLPALPGPAREPVGSAHALLEEAGPVAAAGGGAGRQPVRTAGFWARLLPQVA